MIQTWLKTSLPGFENSDLFLGHAEEQFHWLKGPSLNLGSHYVRPKTQIQEKPASFYFSLKKA